MDLDEAIMTLRSMRRLTNDPPVTDTEIEHCLRAAVQAPNGGNVQPWQFVVLTDPAVRSRVAEVVQRATERYLAAIEAARPPTDSEEAERSWRRGARLTRHLADHLADIPSVLFVLTPYPNILTDDEGPIEIGRLEASIFPAVQNFLLAARGLGLGTTLTTLVKVYEDEIKQICGIKDHHELMALVPIGRPLGRFGTPPRRPAETVTSWNTYGNRRAFGPG
ncbi:MAG: nitroreductase family protein [Acidimicrobiales bacterium]|nr:nitroreductase family protein [Acidimicrobiales bacterium]